MILRTDQCTTVRAQERQQELEVWGGRGGTLGGCRGSSPRGVCKEGPEEVLMLAK